MWSRDSKLGEQISTVQFLRALPSTLVSRLGTKKLQADLQFVFQQSSERVARPNCPTIVICHPNCDKRSWPWFPPSSLTLVQNCQAATISIMKPWIDTVKRPEDWCIEDSVVRKGSKNINCSRNYSLINNFPN